MQNHLEFWSTVWLFFSLNFFSVTNLNDLSKCHLSIQTNRMWQTCKISHTVTEDRKHMFIFNVKYIRMLLPTNTFLSYFTSSTSPKANKYFSCTESGKSVTALDLVVLRIANWWWKELDLNSPMYSFRLNMFINKVWPSYKRCLCFCISFSSRDACNLAPYEIPKICIWTF